MDNRYYAVGNESQERLENTVSNADSSPGTVAYPMSNERIMVGVHSYGQDPNYSIRLRQEILNRWHEWSKL